MYKCDKSHTENIFFFFGKVIRCNAQRGSVCTCGTCTAVRSLDLCCVFAGEAGAAYLLLFVRQLPVQQRQGEGGSARPRADLLSVVAAQTG